MDTPSSHHQRPVISIGEILIDFIVDDGETSLEAAHQFVARPGGAPANTAVALARLGVPSAFCGVVGKDPFGLRLKSGLAHEGVDASDSRKPIVRPPPWPSPGKTREATAISGCCGVRMPSSHPNRSKAQTSR